jgi:hypothetical protein
MFVHGLYARPRRVRQRRGGWRQQAAAAADDDSDAVAIRPSRLGLGLLRDWADGHMSAAQLQQHASNAKADGLNDPLIDRLSSVGTQQNAQAGLMRLLTELGPMDMISNVEHSSWKQVILPSTWLSYICKNQPRDFRLRFGADPNKVEDFWRQFLRRPGSRSWAEQHTLLRGKSAEELRFAIPCAVHEDAGPYLNFSSLLASGPERLTIFLCATAIKKEGDDLNVWRVVLEDFDNLATGHIDGQAIARDVGGHVWTIVLLVSKGDEEVKVNDYGFPSWASRQEICAECHANRSTHPYTDIQPSAKWRETEITEKEPFLSRSRKRTHPLLASQYTTRYFFGQI